MRELWRKVLGRLALLPEAMHARRSGGRGLLTQAADLARLRFGPTRLRAAEYYDFRLWDRRYTMADRRAFAGEDFKNGIHRRLNNKAWEVLMTDKLAEAVMFEALGLPHAKVLAVATAEPRLFSKAPSLTTPESLAEFLRHGLAYPAFVKPIKGQEGRGCSSLRAYDPLSDRLIFGDGQRAGVDKFVGTLHDPTGYGFVFLEHLESHPAVREMCGDAVSSVRMIALLHDEGPQLLHADWAVPAGRSIVSNFAKGETGNMVGGLDLATGEVTRVMAGVGRGRHDVATHPMSRRRMRGFRLPDWKEAVDLCLRAATGFPGARWQNWDIGLTTRGPVLLELNSSGDVYAVQYITERGILAGPLGPFLAKYSFRDDRPRRLFPAPAPPPPVHV